MRFENTELVVIKVKHCRFYSQGENQFGLNIILSAHLNLNNGRLLDSKQFLQYIHIKDDFCECKFAINSLARSQTYEI